VGHVREELRLVLARFGKLFVRLLQLPEQPGILDRDDRLVGERLNQGDLALTKRPLFVAVQADNADRFTAKQQWNAELGAVAVQVGPHLRVGILVVDHGEDIRDVDRSSFEIRAPRNAGGGDR
jgi:hypothetical protein